MDSLINHIKLNHWVLFGGQAVTAMVQQAMRYIDDTPSVESRIELIETLSTVSAGKVQLKHFHWQELLEICRD